MNFLELVMTVCTLANTNLCEDKRIRLDENVSVMECLVEAQPTMAQWVADNPNWKIMRWSCEYAQRRRTKV
jgi:hypothetical protein